MSLIEIISSDADDAPIEVHSDGDKLIDFGDFQSGNLLALANLATAADTLAYWTGAGTAALTTLTSYARGLLACANSVAALAALGAQPVDTTLSALAGTGLGGAGQILTTDGTDFAWSGTGLTWASDRLSGSGSTAPVAQASNAWSLGNGTGRFGTALIVDGTGAASIQTAGGIDATSASGVITRAAATQDAIRIIGRAGGTLSYIGTITPTTLTASRTWTMPDLSLIMAGSAAALTPGRVPFVTTGGALTDYAGLLYNSGANSFTIGIDAGSSCALTLNAQAGASRQLIWATAGSQRWNVFTLGAESGSDAGASLAFRALSDAGVSLGDIMTLQRAAGAAVLFTRPITTTGVVTAPNGSAAAPSYRIAGEQSGMYRYDANTLGFTVAGVAAARVGATLISADGDGNWQLAGVRKAPGGVAVSSFTGNMSIRYFGWDGTAFNAASFPDAAIYLNPNQPFTVGAHGTNIVFSCTPNGSATPATAMQLDSEKLAILATTPSTGTTTAALVVSGGIGVGGGAFFGGDVTRVGSSTAQIEYLIQNTGSGTTSRARYRATNAAGDVSVTAGIYNASNTQATYGFALGNWAGIECGSSGANGLVIGCSAVDKPIVFGINASEVARLTGGTLATGSLDVKYTGQTAIKSAGQINIATLTPASASATGVAGTIAWDVSYIYVCTATNTWKRAAIATW